MHNLKMVCHLSKALLLNALINKPHSKAARYEFNAPDVEHYRKLPMYIGDFSNGEL